jgi:hypothetical protein
MRAQIGSNGLNALEITLSFGAFVRTGGIEVSIS